MVKVIKKQLKSKKGFTLVEVIVVLVIVAILAAIAVPALTGYIDQAKEKSVLLDARNLLVGMQSMATIDGIDNAGRVTGYFVCTPGHNTAPTGNDLSDLGREKIVSLINIDPDKVKYESLDPIWIVDSVITKFIYKYDGYQVVYENGEYTVTEMA